MTDQIQVHGEEDPQRPGWGRLFTEQPPLALGPVPEALVAAAAHLLAVTARARVAGEPSPPVPLEIADEAAWQLSLARWAIDAEPPGARRQAADLLAEREGAGVMPLLLVRCLEDPDEELRRHLACLLQGIDPERATRAMLEQLGGPDAELARRAAMVLEQHQDPDNMALLSEALEDPRAQVRRHVAELLGKMYDPAALDPLLRSLADPVAAVRAAAAWALGELADPAATDGLVERLADEAGEVRACAARSLAEIGDERAEPGLIGLLTDPFVAARRWGSLALQRLAGPAAVTPLIGALADADGEVRQNAARGLGLLRDGRAVAPLIERLADADPEVAWTAADALADLADPAAIGPLLDLLVEPERPATVLLAGIEALERLGAGDRLIAPLVGLLGHPDAEARSHAAEALTRRDPAEAVPALVAHLEQRALPPEARVYAIPALAALGDPRAAPVLRGLLETDEPDWLQEFARQALEELA